MLPSFEVTRPTIWVRYSIACGQGQACVGGKGGGGGVQIRDEGKGRAMQPSRCGRPCMLESCSQQRTSVWFILTMLTATLTTTKTTSRINCFSTQSPSPHKTDCFMTQHPSLGIKQLLI